MASSNNSLTNATTSTVSKDVAIQPAWNTLQELQRGAQRLGWKITGLLAFLVSILIVLIWLALLDGNPIPPIIAAALILPILFSFFPRGLLFLIIFACCLIETYDIGFKDGITERIPFFWNLNSTFQRFGHDKNFKALPMNMFELFLLWSALVGIMRSVFQRHTVLFRPGAIFWSLFAYLVFVGIAWVNGMATGGVFSDSLIEARSQVYFAIAYFLAVTQITSKGQVRGMFTMMVICIAIKAFVMVFRRYVTLAGTEITDQGVGAHEEAFFFDVFEVLLLILGLSGTEKRLTIFMTVLLPLVLLGNVACNRRAATAAFAVLIPMLLTLVYRAFPRRRKGILAFILAFVTIGPIYFFAFRNSQSAIAQPARAIQSQFAPDERDYRSNLYRLQENANIRATIKGTVANTIIGYGYGKRMYHVVEMADISNLYKLWDLLPHNQILWVWMRVGTLGFLAFWCLIASILIRCCFIVRSDEADDYDKAIAIFVFSVVTMLLIFGLLDVQLSNFRDMLLAGTMAGISCSTLFKRYGTSENPGVPLDEGKTSKAQEWATWLLRRLGVIRNILPINPPVAVSLTSKSQPLSAAKSLLSGKKKTSFPNPLEFIESNHATPSAPFIPEPAFLPTPVLAPSDSNNKQLAGNFVTTMITQILTWVIAFGVNLYVPKLIGQAALGRLAASSGLIAILSVLVAFGTSNVLTREVALNPKSAPKLLWLSLGIRLLLGGIFLGFIWLVVPHLPAGQFPSVKLLMAALIATTSVLLGEAFATTLRALGNCTCL